MEVRFVSIAAFRTTLDSLLKVKKGVLYMKKLKRRDGFFAENSRIRWEKG